MGASTKCSGCGKEIDARKNEGLEAFGLWYCSACFIGRAQSLHRELKPEDVELLKVIGRELSGLLPPDLVEMILVGYYRRASGKAEAPPREETLRAVGEIQRLTAFASFRQMLNLLKTWQGIFDEFVGDQEREIQDRIKRLTDLEP